MSANIANLPELLSLDKSQLIKKSEIKCLTDAGDNYGSLMLKVDVEVEAVDGSTEEIHVVAKTHPPDPIMRELFVTHITLHKEIMFYKEIVPTLREFQRENGVAEVINFSAKYCGSRTDQDLILLLENLKLQNYINLDRAEGLDLDVARLILTDLASFHAVPLCLKLKKPDVFEAKVKPYLRSQAQPEKFRLQLGEFYVKLLEKLEEIRPFLHRVKKVSFTDMYRQEITREPFGTICHNDCWTNNTMQLLENGKPVNNKLVDFQFMDYGSPAKDVLFFLYSSVKTKILEEHCDDLIEFYYEKFVSILKTLGVDETRFSRELFQEEIKFEARETQLAHILLMLFPIFAPKDGLKKFEEFDPNVMPPEMTREHREKLLYVIKDFVERGWI